MRILADIIDWKYPDKKRGFSPSFYDLNNSSHTMEIYMGLANGTILEMRAISENEEVAECIELMVQKVGSCRETELTPEERSRLWLFQEGDICYKQGDDAYMFLVPEPRPDLFL